MYMLIMLVSLTLTAVSIGAKDENSVETMLRAMLEAQEARMRALEDTIASLRDTKTEHTQVRMTTGGEVVELVSAAEVKALEKSVEACEEKNMTQDAKIGMPAATIHEMRQQRKDGRAGAPPAPPPQSPPPAAPPSPRSW